jgi:tetratricopeptide (TPR) repeat protein
LYLMRDCVALDTLNLEVAERAASSFPHDAELLFETGQAGLEHVRSLAKQANNLGANSREFQELESRKRGRASTDSTASPLVAEYDRTAELIDRCFEAILREASESSYGSRVRGYMAESQNHVDEALADYHAGGDHFAAGRLLAQNTAYDEAVTEFKAELSSHPDNHLALAQLSQLYVQLGKLDLARPILDQLLMLYPGDEYAWLDKGRIEQKSGHWQEAADSFKRALSIDPNLSQARYRLATVYRNLGQNAAAADELEAFGAGKK